MATRMKGHLGTPLFLTMVDDSAIFPLLRPSVAASPPSEATVLYLSSFAFPSRMARRRIRVG